MHHHAQGTGRPTTQTQCSRQRTSGNSQAGVPGNGRRHQEETVHHGPDLTLAPAQGVHKPVLNAHMRHKQAGRQGRVANGAVQATRCAPRTMPGTSTRQDWSAHRGRSVACDRSQQLSARACVLASVNERMCHERVCSTPIWLARLAPEVLPARTLRKQRELCFLPGRSALLTCCAMSDAGCRARLAHTGSPRQPDRAPSTLPLTQAAGWVPLARG